MNHAPALMMIIQQWSSGFGTGLAFNMSQLQIPAAVLWDATLGKLSPWSICYGVIRGDGCTDRRTDTVIHIGTPSR